jgi:uncharacterized protein GlcG (DUF336 family)
MLSIPSLDLKDAQRLAKAAVAAAADAGVNATVVVLDAVGMERARLRMDGGSIASGFLAGKKAHTALSTRAPTSVWAERVKANEHLAVGLFSFPDLCPLPGGLPVLAGDAVVGAIGISGGTVDQDEEIARQALAAW